MYTRGITMTRILFILAALLSVAGGVAFAQPVPNMPANGSTNQPINVTLGWRALSAVQFYEVNLSENTAFDDFEVMITEKSAVDAENLLYQTTYHWRVRGVDGDGEPTTDWSNSQMFTTKSDRGIPQPVTPEDGATDQELTLTATWTSVDPVVGYEVQRAPNSSFTAAETQNSETTGTTITFTGLEYATQYFWRVRAMTPGAGPGEWSRYVTFTTKFKDPDPLLAPRLLSPANMATGLPTTVELEWGDVPGNVAGEEIMYDVEIATDATFGELIPGTSDHELTTLEVASLEHATTYFWRVRAYNAETESPWSQVWQFTTEKDSTTFLVAPHLRTPINGAGQIPSDPLLTWDSVEGATFYEVHLARDAKFVLDSIPTMISDSTSLTLSELEPGTTYYWRARAGDEKGMSAWSKPFRFITKKDELLAPTAPFLIAPDHKATDVNAPVELIWSKTENAAEYFVQISTANEFAGEEDDLSEFDTTMIIDELKEGTTYFWRVQAVNEAGESEWSEVRSFTLSGDALPLPGLPTLIAPANTTKDLEAPVQLVWSTATNAAEYMVQVSSTGAFAGEESAVTGTDTTETIAGLKEGAQYFWRVKSTNLTGDSEWSTTWSFTIKEAVTSVEEEKIHANAVRLYPVPATHQLTIETGADAVVAVRLFNQNGERVVVEEEIEAGHGSRRVEIGLEGIASGTYYCRIILATGAVLTRPVLVVK